MFLIIVNNLWIYFYYNITGFAKENHGPSADCPTCKHPVKQGELGVVATRIGDDVSIITTV